MWILMVIATTTHDFLSYTVTFIEEVKLACNILKGWYVQKKAEDICNLKGLNM